ncbi:uncharacterized protein Nmlp_3527 [Natronomonas moolapensis 8.8.11]|uniref:Uncharacterized protein n=1 Tax=Natronomonas moolapensis (strain DSM 18674 / CECT 7526 / JCM 14361 / 8.8.11) TaxID=268739 RepID=M1Y532_NATM8|nr:hypothetical protein [Natronomonas moolapensis]CCQ37652.1 uncharacterized protein Nmlp_3527 [Natronomonas moolapensis 8.8.11]
MPDGELVVGDTSPLLNVALIGRLDLLREQFDGVTAPEQVWDELAAGDDGLDDLRALRDGGFLELVPVEESSLFVELRRELDRLRAEGFWISDELYHDVLDAAVAT